MARETPSSGYRKLAKYYDAIYKELVDYEAQADRIEKMMRIHSKERPKRILDLACGTGNYTFLFAKRGYDVTGVDLSQEMISIAREKALKTRKALRPSFSRMDISKLCFKGASHFDAALVLFGGFGYLLGQRRIDGFFSSVKANLASRGLLIFEFWQGSGVRSASRSKTGFRSWDRIETPRTLLIRLNTSWFDPRSEIVTVNFECYVMNKQTMKVEDVFTERHRLQSYSIEEVRKLLQSHGFTPLAFYSGELSHSRRLTQADSTSFRVISVSEPNEGVLPVSRSSPRFASTRSSCRPSSRVWRREGSSRRTPDFLTTSSLPGRFSWPVPARDTRVWYTWKEDTATFQPADRVSAGSPSTKRIRLRQAILLGKQ